MHPTALELERQQRREVSEIRRGETAYNEAMLVKDPSSLPSGKRLMREIIPALTVALEAHQEECLEAIKQSGGARMPYLWAIQTVKAQTLAFLTLDVALRCEISPGSAQDAMPLTGLAALLGKVVKEHAEVKELADRDGRDVLAALKQKFKAVNRMTWSRWKKKAGALKHTWSAAVRVHLGAALLAKLIEAAPAHFAIEHRNVGAGRVQLFLTVTDQTRAVIDDVEQRRAIAMPHYTPMVIRPLDWRYAEPSLSRMSLEEDGSTAPHRQGKLEGGYVVHKLAFVRTGREEHTKALEGAVSALDMAAANRIQSTGWAVNRWLYDVMSEAWANGLRLGKLETGAMLPHAGRLDDETFRGLSKEDKGAYCRKRLAIHKANGKRKARFNQIVDYLAVARELRDEPVFYYPHVHDFRHRIYPVPVRGPHPQGDDIAKSLIHFAEGKPLGETGEFWLRVHTANCAGQDKLTLEERVQWTFNHQADLRSYVSTPLSSTGWTTTASPWSFLAAAHELCLCLETTEPCTFISHLPVALDGSCNGIQHLSAMGLDPIGAQATNLRPGDRQDIYTLVALKASDRCALEAATGHEAASAWNGKISRQTVKRAVMTTPYGVTARGIRDQLLADELVPGNDGQLADYMRDCICEALSGTVVAAKDIMGWLQDCAKALGKAGLPLRWETPSGSRCSQAYHATSATVVRTLCGSLTLLQEDSKATLRPSKQALASAPNIVHSFDAAHLTMTVMAGAERGISHWAMIHDSFATHAGSTQTLCAALREQFVAIYQHDWLARIYEGFKAYAPHVQLPLPPARGTFDIEEVHDSSFFFS